MVIRLFHPRSQERAALQTDLVVAMAILAATMLPLAYSFEQEMKLCRNYYGEAVAMEVVDGEMEILAAGEWRAFQPGPQPYSVKAEAAKNLPPGRFTLTVGEPIIRLEWHPEQRGKGRPVMREARVK